jgi:N-acetyl-anhydromuramyl-L-alanine amidase AmpD
MREINLIVIHCSATRADRNITAQDINAAHKVRGFSSWGYHYYIRKNGKVEPMRSVDEVGAHARGYNAKSIGVCYEGGLDTNGKPADTRTFLKEHPGCKVVGHRDLSPDKNYNGIIDPWERVKECPCFSVLDESWE